MNKKIGHQVCLLRTNENIPRNGECSFARLKNGDIFFDNNLLLVADY